MVGLGTAVYKYLMLGSKKDGDMLFLEARSRDNEQKLEHGKISTSYREIIAYCEC